MSVKGDSFSSILAESTLLSTLFQTLHSGGTRQLLDCGVQLGITHLITSLDLKGLASTQSLCGGCVDGGVQPEED